MGESEMEAPVGITSNRRIVTIALLLSMAVAALEQTVVSTAMPTIIARLRGLDIYPWVFSAYLLAATVSTPLYGKLADLFGRKRVLLFGLGLFGLGSALSGLAQSMPQLIGMRALQGLGAGAVGPIVLTMLGDLYPLRERARVQGWFSAVWGVSSLAGPALGGVLTDQLSWRWVFFVTIPFAAIAATVLAVFVRESVARRPSLPLDWPGAVLLTAGTSVLLLAALGTEGRSRGSEIALLAAAVALIATFVVWERRAVDPVLPIDLLTTGSTGAAIVGSFLIGAILFGLDTYVPLFVQGVRGGRATEAGRMLTPLFLSWSISVAVAARVVVRYGFRYTCLVGSALIAGGLAGLTVGIAVPGSATFTFPIAMMVIGLGMGPTSLSHILSVQHTVPWNRRGVATGAVTFFRTIGGALGVGLLGALLGLVLGHALHGWTGLDVAAALRPETHASLRPDQLAAVQAGLRSSLLRVFAVMTVMGLAGMVCALGLPLAHGPAPVPDSTAEPADESEPNTAPVPVFD